MREVLQLEHLLGMRAGYGQQGVVPHQGSLPTIRALLVDQVEHLPLGARIGRELQLVREVELLGVVLAELRDEGRDRVAELPGQRRELWLDRADSFDETAGKPG